MTPTARTLVYLRDCGHIADVVERWVPGANIRKDLFGIIDVVAVRRGEQGVLGVQATSLSNVSARVAKAKGKAELRTWLAAGNRFAVYGWYQRAGRWQVKIVALTGEDLAADVVLAPKRRGKKLVQGDLFREPTAAASGVPSGSAAADVQGGAKGARERQPSL